MTDTEIIVTNMTLDDLFIAMQPTEEDREQARCWIENERHINTMTKESLNSEDMVRRQNATKQSIVLS